MADTIFMETQREYYEVTSAEPNKAMILEIGPSKDGNAQVLLDRTIFYPEGGGQPSDRGTINGVPLLDVREKDKEILHLVPSAHNLIPGPAELILDSRRRREFSVLHTGQHLLSGTILRMIGKPTVSMHLGDETCTIDVEAAEISDDDLTAIEEEAAGKIEENHPVVIHLCPPEDVSSFPLRKIPPQGEEVIRVVEIEGNDFSPCCGTHVRSTAEIGMLRILGAEKYKGMTRITFIAGRRVLRDSRILHINAGIASRALKVPVNETGKGIVEFMEKTSQLEKRLKGLEEEAALFKAQALLGKASLPAKGREAALIIETYNTAGIDEVLRIGKAAQKLTPKALLLVSGQDLKFSAFCSDKGFDLRPIIKDAFEAQGGRGGGNASFFQGSFATKEALDAFIKAVAH